jgi:hypothetical protein
MDTPPKAPDFTTDAPGVFHAAHGSAAAVDAACNVADFIRNYVRDRQTEIRKHCDSIHDAAPIQGQAWKLALEELDHVAVACISVSRRTMKQPNVPLCDKP